MIVSYTNEKVNLKMMEPLFTSYDSYKISLIKQIEEKDFEQEIVTIGGNLCIAADILAKDILLSKSEINDLISINNAGSYAYTLTPILFSSHERPVEIYFKNINDYIVE